MTDPWRVVLEWIERKEDFLPWIPLLSQSNLLAIDVEQNGYYGYLRNICLLQVAFDGHVLLFDIPKLSLDVLEPLKQALFDEDIRVIAHSGNQDLKKLCLELDFRVTNFVDTQIIASFLGETYLGLDKLVKKYNQEQMDSKDDFHKFDWSIRPLPDDALDYASQDVALLLPLYETLWSKLQETPFVEAVMEESQALADQEFYEEPFEPDGFHKIKKAFQLGSSQRAILKELYLWRHEQCMKEDKAAFLVCPDHALLVLSMRAPSSQKELNQITALKKHQIRDYGSGMLMAIGKGKLAPPVGRPTRQNTHKLENFAILSKHVEAFKHWREDVAEELGISSSLLITNKNIMVLLRKKPRSLEELAGIDGMYPWKRKLFGEDLLALLKDVP